MNRAAAKALVAELTALSDAEAAAVIATLDAETAAAIAAAWVAWGHAGQLAPEGDWRTWVMMAGRGFGKTRAGSEWVLGLVRPEGVASPHIGRVYPSFAPFDPARAPRGNRDLSQLRIALVAATLDEARAVMVEGASGIIACAGPDDVSRWEPSLHKLTFNGGAQAFLFSGANPEGLRGPEHDFAWCDELAKWARPGLAWDNLQLGLRRGTHPQVLVTTTPRAGPVLKRIIGGHATIVTGGPSRANIHLPDAFLRSMEDAYAGTRLGRQELEGELLEEVEGSLWPQALIERCRVAAQTGAAGNFARVVIGVDPPASAAGTCGIVVCARDSGGAGLVLDDASVAGLSPEGWARAVVAAADRWQVDRIVVEGNQGGNMVESVLRAARATLPITRVHAKAGKAARAEPVAALFESGRAWFAGRFPELEAQLGGLIAGGGYAGPGTSPDRADAMVWALWALLLVPGRGPPRVRKV